MHKEEAIFPVRGASQAVGQCPEWHSAAGERRGLEKWWARGWQGGICPNCTEIQSIPLPVSSFCGRVPFISEPFSEHLLRAR